MQEMPFLNIMLPPKTNLLVSKSLQKSIKNYSKSIKILLKRVLICLEMVFQQQK